MSKSNFKGSLLATTIIAGAVVATPAFAQEAVPAQNPTNVQGTTPPAPAADETPAEGVQTSESAAPAEPTSAEEIVVTGTLIRNPNLVASAPVTVVGQEEMQLRQTNVAEEVLRTIPGAAPSIGSQVNNGSGGNAYVNLRGLGSKRNLVLLDGVRITPSDLLGRVDLNNIPLAVVDRVDVLTGGASSTYGADAVGGVVNFITRSDFSGMELQVSDQITQRGDGNYLRGDLSIGANFDDGRGNAVISVGYQESDPVFFGSNDRVASHLTLESYDRFFVAGQGSSTTTPSRLSITGLPTQQVSADATSIVPFYAAYNFNPWNVFQTPFKRYNLYSSGHYDISDHITAYARGLYSNNEVDTIIAPSGIFGAAITFNTSNPFLTDTQAQFLCLAAGDVDPVTAGVQLPTAAQCAAARTANPGQAGNINFAVGVGRRMPELGPRNSSYEAQVFDFRVGLRGDITDAIGWDVWGARGASDETQFVNNYALLSRARAGAFAIRDSGGNIVCTTATGAAPTAGCVPVNFFGIPGTITPQQADFLSEAATVRNRTTLAQARGTINGDAPFAMPWSEQPLAFAVGTEYRKYGALQASDLLAKTPGELGGAGGAQPDVDGGYDVYEGFAEIIAPIVTDRPFFNELQVEAGVRRSHYTVDAPTAGNPKYNTTTWKVAGSWEPVNDIKFRGNYQHAVRAPNISELFFPVVTGLTNLATDPCSGQAPLGDPNLLAICLAQGAPPATIGNIPGPISGQVQVTGGGNLFLRPETANTWTVGAVLRPRFIPGLNATIDYYNIKVKDAITTPTPDDQISACFGNIGPGTATNPACLVIRRNPITGGLSGDPSDTPGLFAPLSNLGKIETSGFDATLNYRRSLGTLIGAPARLNLALSGNHLLESKFQATPSSINRECAGFYSVNCDPPNPKWTGNTRATLSLGRVDMSVLWRYIHKVRFEEAQLEADIANASDNPILTSGPFAGQRGPCIPGTIPRPDPLGPGGVDPGGCIVDPEFRKIKAHNYFDFTSRFNVNEHFDLTFTIQNLLDKKPPLLGGTVGTTTFNGGNTYPATYDPLGRRFAAGARVKF
jgi:iron complex outermembrane recepter protein